MSRRRFVLVLAAILGASACNVKPLPVPNRSDWDPASGATDYPSLRAVRDAGHD